MKIMFARISDNVLEEKHWGVMRLVIGGGIVAAQEPVSRGVYALGGFVGWSVASLATWTRYDATGTHPEQYHELADGKLDDVGIPAPGKFRDFWTAEEVEAC
jgi:hypothetical protein